MCAKEKHGSKTSLNVLPSSSFPRVKIKEVQGRKKPNKRKQKCFLAVACEEKKSVSNYTLMSHSFVQQTKILNNDEATISLKITILFVVLQPICQTSVWTVENSTIFSYFLHFFFKQQLILNKENFDLLSD